MSQKRNASVNASANLPFYRRSLCFGPFVWSWSSPRLKFRYYSKPAWFCSKLCKESLIQCTLLVISQVWHYWTRPLDDVSKRCDVYGDGNSRMVSLCSLKLGQVGWSDGPRTTCLYGEALFHYRDEVAPIPVEYATPLGDNKLLMASTRD